MTLIAPDWEVLAGAVTGRAHQRARRGGQDACAVRRLPGFVVAVVCDGCSAGASSEIGAGLAARFVAADVARRLRSGTAVDDVADAAIDALVDGLGRIARTLALDEDDTSDVAAVIAACLLFTVQVAVVGPERFCVFGVGDGVVRIDGVNVDVDVNDDGAPDCPAYRLIDGLHDHARLVVHARGDTSALRVLTIGSDGALELQQRSTTTLPSGEVFGGLDAFEREARFADNPSLITKRIAALGALAPEDDCTVVVIRRPVPAAIDLFASPTREPPCA